MAQAVGFRFERDEDLAPGLWRSVYQSQLLTKFLQSCRQRFCARVRLLQESATDRATCVSLPLQREQFQAGEPSGVKLDGFSKLAFGIKPIK